MGTRRAMALRHAARRERDARPTGGIRSAHDHTLIPGAVVLDMEFVSPGLDPSTYAYVKTSMQRTLYRVVLD